MAGATCGLEQVADSIAELYTEFRVLVQIVTERSETRFGHDGAGRTQAAHDMRNSGQIAGIGMQLPNDCSFLTPIDALASCGPRMIRHLRCLLSSP